MSEFTKEQKENVLKLYHVVSETKIAVDKLDARFREQMQALKNASGLSFANYSEMDSKVKSLLGEWVLSGFFVSKEF